VQFVGAAAIVLAAFGIDRPDARGEVPSAPAPGGVTDADVARRSPCAHGTSRTLLADRAG